MWKQSPSCIWFCNGIFKNISNGIFIGSRAGKILTSLILVWNQTAVYIRKTNFYSLLSLQFPSMRLSILFHTVSQNCVLFSKINPQKPFLLPIKSILCILKFYLCIIYHLSKLRPHFKMFKFFILLPCQFV